MKKLLCALLITALTINTCTAMEQPNNNNLGLFSLVYQMISHPFVRTTSLMALSAFIGYRMNTSGNIYGYGSSTVNVTVNGDVNKMKINTYGTSTVNVTSNELGPVASQLYGNSKVYLNNRLHAPNNNFLLPAYDRLFPPAQN